VSIKSSYSPPYAPDSPLFDPYAVNNSNVNTPDSPAYAPDSQAYAPDSPAYAPDSPAYVPQTPPGTPPSLYNNSPTSVADNLSNVPTPTYTPHTPSGTPPGTPQRISPNTNVLSGGGNTQIYQSIVPVPIYISTNENPSNVSKLEDNSIIEVETEKNEESPKEEIKVAEPRDDGIQLLINNDIIKDEDDETNKSDIDDSTKNDDIDFSSKKIIKI
jgi:hypothetical protein